MKTVSSTPTTIPSGPLTVDPQSLASLRQSPRASLLYHLLNSHNQVVLLPPSQPPSLSDLDAIIKPLLVHQRIAYEALPLLPISSDDEKSIERLLRNLDRGILSEDDFLFGAAHTLVSLFAEGKTVSPIFDMVEAAFTSPPGSVYPPHGPNPGQPIPDDERIARVPLQRFLTIVRGFGLFFTVPPSFYDLAFPPLPPEDPADLVASPL